MWIILLLPLHWGGGTALKFNGTNAYLYLDSIKDTIANSEDFTISIRVVSQVPPSTKTNANYSFIVCSGFMNYYSNDISPELRTGLWVGNYPTWTFDFPNTNIKTTTASYHLALVRKNNVISMFFNGVKNGSTTTQSYPFIEQQPIYIGYNPSSSASIKYSEYILDDYCIIKGTALWTSDFTPPTTYLPNRI